MTKAPEHLLATLDSTPSQSKCNSSHNPASLVNSFSFDRSLLCGVPMLLIPFFGDQHGNAQKIESGIHARFPCAQFLFYNDLAFQPARAWS